MEGALVFIVPKCVLVGLSFGSSARIPNLALVMGWSTAVLHHHQR